MVIHTAVPGLSPTPPQPTQHRHLPPGLRMTNTSSTTSSALSAFPSPPSCCSSSSSRPALPLQSCSSSAPSPSQNYVVEGFRPAGFVSNSVVVRGVVLRSATAPFCSSSSAPIFFGIGRRSSKSCNRNRSGSFPVGFRRCESAALHNSNPVVVGGMSSTGRSSSSGAIAALVHGTTTATPKEQSVLQKKSKKNDDVVVGPAPATLKKLSIGSKEVVPVAPLPEEIPLESLKVVLPHDDGELCSSSDDDEVGRRVNGNGRVNGIGSVAANGSASRAHDIKAFVLGKNFADLSLTITEPEMDDEVTGDKEAYMAGVLARYRQTLVERTKYHLGYPYNLDFNYQALSQLQHFSINNLGDPFIESNYGVHSRQFEVGVLDWFARLWDLTKDQYWGYITNCGTEGNLHGILVGREVHPDGILYASKDSHYSVFKAARMYRMEVVKVDTLLSGEIDCNDLKRKLEERADKPAILNVNIGTTVKGAVDDLDGVLESLKQAGFNEDRFYIHCDGALFGLMMPFVTKAPRVTFKKPIGSVSVSGHKFIGCPMPCGIQITRVEHINHLSSNVEYLASRDATIMGSRNGHAPLFLWYTLNRKGYRGFQKEVQRCLRNAYYLKDRLRDAGFGVMLNELSSTVVFERPQDENFIRKWQLACQGSIAHAVVMPSVTVEKLDRFLDELIESRANCSVDGKVVVPCIVEEVGPENCACSLHLNRTPVTKVVKLTRGGSSNGFRP